jgi:hypothetical protein
VWGFMDRRVHHRVQLRLLSRLRWTTPFGQKTEVCETLNASRGGVLVPCQQSHAEGTLLWVTFPYDPSILYGQPEISARVMRLFDAESVGDIHANGTGVASGVASAPLAAVSPQAVPYGAPVAARTATSPVDWRATNGNHARAAPVVTALRFEIAPHRRSNGNGNGHKHNIERRLNARQRLAVPVRVRQEHVPWFEETMTIDCSVDGLKFRSNREYEAGQFLVVSFESVDTSPWPSASELLLLVVRIEREPQSPTLSVAVCRSQQFSFKF